MPDVTLTIDGRTVTVPAGTNIVDAARSGEVAIPVFCYHPKLKPVGMCRMCLVEAWTPVIDRATNQPVLDENGQPQLALLGNKLQPGCVTPVSPGMVVKTVTDRVEDTQRGVLEFLLTSHPLDCPVCDKGGECPLQNLTMQWGPGKSRYDYADKHHAKKPVALGDLIFLDRERCILCSRCVRFQDDIAGDPVLGFDNRGRDWEIISKSEPPFDSKFSGNTTDICPVGALTTADFRFRARVWEMRSVPSVCSGCSTGCNITLDTRHNKLMRVMPRENEFVNEIWLCDKGRFGQRFTTSETRLSSPLVRRNGQLVEVSWDEAISLVASKFAEIRQSAGGSALAGLAGTRLANEDLYVFQKLFRQVLGSPNIDHRDGIPSQPAFEDLIPVLGVGSGTNLGELGKGTSVLVIGADPEEEAANYVLRLRGILSRGGEVSVAHAYATKMGRQGTRDIRVLPGRETSFVLALLKVIFEEGLENSEFVDTRVRNLKNLRDGLNKQTLADLLASAGVKEDAVRATARSFAQAENGIIIYGQAALSGDPALLQAIAALALLTGKTGKANNGLIALTPGGNMRGAFDMGVRPNFGPGGAALSQAGLSAEGIWQAASQGQVRGLYIAAMNPARANDTIRQAIEASEFVVVQDLFLTETAQLADVVLPAASFAEREGTFTNAERRVQRFRQALKRDNVLADWDIIRSVAVALNANPIEWDYITSSDIADEISQKVKGYAGTAYTSLELTRKSWGRQPNEAIFYDGTSYENTEGVGVQIAAAAEAAKVAFTVHYREPQPVESNAQFPLTLMPATRHYNGNEWVRDSRLQTHIPSAQVFLSAADAQQLGVAKGELVQVSSAFGTIELPAQVDSGLSAGLVLIPQVRGAELPSVVTGGLTSVSVSKVG
jgi:NADH-quinone oxidoreductase subunit G